MFAKEKLAKPLDEHLAEGGSATELHPVEWNGDGGCSAWAAAVVRPRPPQAVPHAEFVVDWPQRSGQEHLVGNGLQFNLRPPKGRSAADNNGHNSGTTLR